MMAGDSTRPAAATADEFKNTRRLIDPVFMALFSPSCVFLLRAIEVAAAIFVQMYDKIETARKGAREKPCADV
jgi:hypothetical protein